MPRPATAASTSRRRRSSNGVTGFNFHRGCLAIAPRLAERSLDGFAAARAGSWCSRASAIPTTSAASSAPRRHSAPRASCSIRARPIRSIERRCERRWARCCVCRSRRLPNWPEALHTIRGMGFALAALSPSGRTTLDEFAACACTGSARRSRRRRRRGRPDAPRRWLLADATVRIPIDPRSDSLNVVVAVAIALQRLRS